MNTQEIIKLQNKIFYEVKNLWELSEKWTKSHPILDSFLDELNMKKTSENRFIAYSRISELRVEPLELYLENKQKEIEDFNKKIWKNIPNKLQNKREVLNKAYNYVVRVYSDLQEKFIYELEKIPLSKSFPQREKDFMLTIFKWVSKVWKAFNKFMPVWENYIILQNEILDKKFNYDSEKIMDYLREKQLLEVDKKGQESDRSYSVLKAWKIMSYFEAFGSEVNSIIVALQNFIEDLVPLSVSPQGREVKMYINYLESLKEAFLEKNTKKLLNKWQKVDEVWMDIKGALQISHPLEFYEDKYRKWVAPEWDLRIIDIETLKSKVKEDIENMYEKLYDEIWRNKYSESYNFSKDNFNRVQLYISEPVLYFWAELNWMFSAQVVPNDEVISEMYWKKIFAFPKMVLEWKKKAPLMKLTKEVLEESLLDSYLKILNQDKLFFEIYDVETIGHEFGHTLWLTKNTEVEMNKKTWNFKNIEEFKATTWWLVSYFMWEDKKKEFNKNIIITHIVRCIGLLKYMEITEVLPYYNESLIHLDIMFNSEIFEIIPLSISPQGREVKWFKIKLNFTEKNWEKLKENYIKNYKRLILIYLEKKDAWEFLFNYVETDKNWNNLSKNKELKEFVKYYYDLYKKIGNEVV